MNRAGKQNLIERFETAYEPLKERVRNMTEEELSFIPDIPDAWPINDHLVHLLEADAIAWYRFRVAVAEPGAKAPGWDQEAWRSRLKYSAQDGLACLEEAARLRGFIGAACRALIDEDWSAFYYEHPSKGRVDLASSLATYADHAAAHMKYLERNLAAFAER